MFINVSWVRHMCPYMFRFVKIVYHKNISTSFYCSRFKNNNELIMVQLNLRFLTRLYC